MAKSLSQNFHQTEAILDPLQRQPDISEDIQQTLSRLLGWYDFDAVWKFIRTDANGRLLVASGSGLASTVNVNNFTPGAAITSVLAANSSRMKFEIQNAGVSNVFVGFGPLLTLANTVLLSPGDVYHDDIYSGDVYCLTFAASSIQVREWV
jgi:hypothetical protein